jgi:multiple sugar transport system permease protein
MWSKTERWLGIVLVCLLGVLMALPFLYMVSTSLMDEFAVLKAPAAVIPLHPRLENYRAVLDALPFVRFYINSGVVALAVVVGQVSTSAMAAYAFVRLRFPGRDRVWLGYLVILTIPMIVVLIPRFLIINSLGWVDTYQGLIATELVSVWGIFLLRQFFIALPRELEDAARLDGAGEWRIFWRIVVPQARPALVTLAVFAFVDQWKSFFWPLVATRSLRMQVVEVGLSTLHGLYAGNWPYQMAAAVMATLPALLACVVAQRFFLRGMKLHGLK